MYVQFNLFTYYVHLFGLRDLIEYIRKEFKKTIIWSKHTEFPVAVSSSSKLSKNPVRANGSHYFCHADQSPVYISHVCFSGANK